MNWLALCALLPLAGCSSDRDYNKAVECAALSAVGIDLASVIGHTGDKLAEVTREFMERAVYEGRKLDHSIDEVSSNVQGRYSELKRDIASGGSLDTDGFAKQFKPCINDLRPV